MQRQSGSDCEAGECWLIHIEGNDDERRQRLVDMTSIAGFEDLHVPTTDEPVPRYLGWRLAEDTPSYRNAIPDLLRDRAGARATVDSNLLSLDSLLTGEISLPGLHGPLQPIDLLRRDSRPTKVSHPSGLLDDTKSGHGKSNRALFEAIGSLGLSVRPDPSIRTAIVDDGVAPHPDLIGSVTHAGQISTDKLLPLGRKIVAASDVRWDVADNTCYGTHGTMIAGAIGARQGSEAIGLFPGAVIDAWSPGGNCVGRETSCPMCKSALQFTTTIRAAIENGARIVNASFTPRCQDMGHEIWCDTLAYALQHDAIVVIAAGNSCMDLDRTCLTSFRQFPNVLIATSCIGNSVAFNFGARTVSLAVPFDQQMLTTSKDPDPRAHFGYSAGVETSFAAAITSAAAAMVLAHPNFSGAKAPDIAQALLRHARKDVLDAAKPIDPSGGVLSLAFLH